MTGPSNDPNFESPTRLPKLTVPGPNGRRAPSLDESEVPVQMLETWRIDLAKATPVPLLRIKLTHREGITPGQAVRDTDAVCREIDRLERRLGGGGLDWKITLGDGPLDLELSFRPLRLDGDETARQLAVLVDTVNANKKSTRRRPEIEREWDSLLDRLGLTSDQFSSEVDNVIAPFHES